MHDNYYMITSFIFTKLMNKLNLICDFKTAIFTVKNIFVDVLLLALRESKKS